MTAATVGSAPARISPSMVLGIVSAGVTLANLDLFIVNIAFPALENSFDGTGLSTLSWVLNGYAIVFAALLVPAGRLADRYSRKGGFLLGVAVFTAGSAACAAAPGVWALIVFRLVQAAGGALLVPTSLSLLLAAYPPARRQGAVRVWASMAAVAGALGPALGGVLAAQNWRWIFLVNVPIGIALLVIGAMLLTDSAPPQPEPRPDTLGTVLLATAIAALTLALVKAGDWGWDSARFVTTLLAALVLTVAFVAQSRRHPSPIIEAAIVRARGFSLASWALALFSAAFSVMLLSLVIWCQREWGWSALRTGLAIAPGPLLVPFMSALAGRLAPRIGAGAVAALGCVAYALGMVFLVVGIHVGHGYLGGMLPGILVANVGIGLALPTLIASGAGALPPPRFATGSAVLNMARQVGYVLGVALFVVLEGTPHSSRDSLHTAHRIWIISAALSLAAAVIAVVLRARSASPRPTGTAAVGGPVPSSRSVTASAAAPSHAATGGAALPKGP